MSEVRSCEQSLSHPQIHLGQSWKIAVLNPLPAITHAGKCRLCMKALQSQRAIKHPSNRMGDSGGRGRERKKNFKLNLKWTVPGGGSCSTSKPGSMLSKATSTCSYWEIPHKKAGQSWRKSTSSCLARAGRKLLGAALGGSRDGAGGHVWAVLRSF